MPEKKELQLQGPRPSALKITKDSHKIKKPPLPPPQPHRPVIIYTVSPKIIHTDPTQFKDLVQRLTGHHQPPSSSSNHALVHDHPPPDPISIPITDAIDDQAGGVDRIIAHGILSPTPGLLPPISPTIFSTPPPQAAAAATGDLTSLTQFFHDLSPIPANHFSPSLDFFQQNFPDFH
ncbi:protein MKS1-like [Cucumis melo var. makuwa]|uniref:Protein MKS1-like n=2 Tax=Cucumis melo TaxID=3656 RepID=A0A5A7UZA1_CUCMM|nr:protein MKS1-like [Cucumis melo]KAA0058915.1 protein MKS1-like [Cucumis melo var. makuwa]